MKILFVRHAKAYDKFSWQKSDMLRPLVQEGIMKATKGFNNLAKIYGKIDMIISSNALRASETAQILSEAFGGVKIVKSDLLNPGADFESFKEAVLPYFDDKKTIAITGHEPDFSFIISHMISENASAEVEVKKSSAIEVECNQDFYGILTMSLPPKILTKCM